MPYDVPDLARLAPEDISRLAKGRDLPPVQDWHPDAASDSLMRIDAEGRWYHDGAPIGRPAMVRAFSRLLRQEPDGRYALVLPYEKQWIAVEDAPFQAVELRVQGTGEAAVLSFQPEQRRYRDRRTGAPAAHRRPRRRSAALSACAP